MYFYELENKSFSWSFWRLEQTSRRGWGSGFIRCSLPSYSTPQPHARQKGLYPTRRYHSLRKSIYAIILTIIYIVILTLLWQILEYFIYGEIQYRIVDDIMMLFFIPFIYKSIRD